MRAMEVTMPRARLTLAACFVPVLIMLPVLAQDGDDAAFDRTPVECILSSSIDRHQAIDDQNILFYMRDKRVYRNHLPRKCPGLERENRISYELQGTRRLCSINTITVLEDGFAGGFRPGFTCRLGEFVPLSPAEIEDLLLLNNERRDGRGGGRGTQSTIETTEVELPPAEAGSEGEQPAVEPAPATDELDD
jgi:hypothetical protein